MKNIILKLLVGVILSIPVCSAAYAIQYLTGWYSISLFVISIFVFSFLLYKFKQISLFLSSNRSGDSISLQSLLLGIVLAVIFLSIV